MGDGKPPPINDRNVRPVTADDIKPVAFPIKGAPERTGLNRDGDRQPPLGQVHHRNGFGSRVQNINFDTGRVHHGRRGLFTDLDAIDLDHRAGVDNADRVGALVDGYQGAAVGCQLQPDRMIFEIQF